MPSNEDYNRLVRSLNRLEPQHPEARRIVGKVTSRDLHPTLGSEALMAKVSAGTPTTQVVSLNSPGGGKRFVWGVKGFGWGNGDLM